MSEKQQKKKYRFVEDLHLPKGTHSILLPRRVQSLSLQKWVLVLHTKNKKH